jgi:hypothetical protein
MDELWDMGSAPRLFQQLERRWEKPLELPLFQHLVKPWVQQSAHMLVTLLDMRSVQPSVLHLATE